MFCCPCSCFLTLQRLSVFPQPLTDLLSSALKCVWGGASRVFPPLFRLLQKAQSNCSWFHGLIKFLTLLLFFLCSTEGWCFCWTFPPFIWSLFSGSGIYFSNIVFFPLITVREMKSVLGACQKQLFSKQISSTLTSLRVGSSHLKSIFQISPKSKSGVDSHYCVLALTPSSVSHPPFSCPSWPSSVCSRPVP